MDIKKFMLFLLNFFMSISEDLFILGGLGLIIYTTYKINFVAGNYVLGVLLVLFGLFLSKRGK